jgi:predicted ATPase/DNA-binding SARP family transcriptional activator
MLAGLLWPERSEHRARRNLRQTLFELRRAIGDHDASPPFLLITRDTIQFNPLSDHWLDTAAFDTLLDACEEHDHSHLEKCDTCLDRLAQAVSLYEGRFLAGFQAGDSLGFEEWAQLEAERYLRRAQDTLYLLTQCREKQGEVDQALKYAWQLVDLDPWREQTHRQLMRLLASSGRRNAALAQFEICRSVLLEEMGVEPEPETTALYRQIRDSTTPETPAHIPRHNLPISLSPFIGRQEELEELGCLLKDPNCRLLTLLGPGGIGKTRLALEAARAELQAFPDGVFIVSLIPLESPEAIIPTMAEALGFSFRQPGEPAQQLLDYVREKRLFLILDSFEHIPEATEWVVQVLEAATNLRILITSRAKLKIGGGHLFPVGGMSFPEDEVAPNVAEYPAVQLFLQAARMVRPGYDPDADELSEVAHICQIVEGMPLAILMAAAWIQMLTPAEIAKELIHGIDFLTTDWKDLAPRHRSIRAVFDRSWNQLTEQEQAVFRSLSVFRGGFTRKAAEEVTGASLQDLLSLMGKSLLSHTPGGRYELHDLVRQYAEEKLTESTAAWESANDRHSKHFAEALDRWEADLKGARQQVALAELDTEIENAQASWNWAAERQQLESLEQALEGLCLFYEYRVRYQDGASACRTVATQLEEMTGGEQPGRDSVEETANGLRVHAMALAWQSRFELLAKQPEPARQSLELSKELLERPELTEMDTRQERAFILLEAGNQIVHADPDTAEGLYKQGLDLYRKLDDRWRIANALERLSYLAVNRRDYDDTRRWGEEGLVIRKALGDQRGIADILISLCGAAAFQAQFEEGERLARERIAIYRELGDKNGVADGLRLLGGVLFVRGRFDKASSAFEECLPILSELGIHHYSLAYTYAVLSHAKIQMGRYDEAYSLLEQGLALSREIGFQRGTGFSLSGLAYLLMPEEKHLEAQRLMEEAISVFQAIQQGEQLAGAVGALAVTAVGLGQPSQARKHLREALGLISQTGAIVPLFWSILPAVALLLAHQGEPERAVEIYALASRFPFVANSQWIEDISGRYVAAAAASLPPDVLEAAKARGSTRDVQATVAELRAELE